MITTKKIIKIFGCFFVFLISQNIVPAKKILELINNLQPYSMVIFTNTIRDISAEQNIFLKELVNQNSAVNIKLSEVNQTNWCLEMPIFRNPRRSTIYVILSSEDSEILANLDDIAKISPISSRPKTLLFLSKNSTITEMKIFKKAWALKFLDFTVLTPNRRGNHSFMVYNPFSDTYASKSLKNVNKLFPNKLNNVYGYFLITQAFHSSPTITTEVRNNKIVKVGGTRFIRIKTIAEKLNFNLKFIEDSYNLSATFPIICKNLETNVINMSPVGLLLTPKYQNKSVVAGNSWNLDRQIVIAPIVKYQKINATIETFDLLFIFCAILIIFYIFVLILRPILNYWNIFYIFGVLIGTPIMEPRKNVDKIIYLVIAFLSIVFSNSYFSMLADVKVLIVDEELNLLEDLQRINIPIYYSSAFSDLYMNNIIGRKHSLKTIDTVADCIDLLIKTRYVACIAGGAQAEYYSKTIFDTQDKPIMRIMDLSFKNELDMYFYEKASPFAEKFDEILQQIFESSIVKLQDSRVMNKIQIIDSKQSDMVERSLMMEMIFIILFFGYALACVTFAWEYVRFYGFKQILNCKFY